MKNDRSSENQQNSAPTQPMGKNIKERRLGFIVGVLCTVLAAAASDMIKSIGSTEQTAPTPKYKALADEDKAAIKRINAQAALFAEHFSMCAAGTTPAERYTRTHRLVSSFVDAALLDSVDPAKFANSLEHAMIQSMRIVPTELPEGILAVFHDNADQGPDVMLVQKDTMPIYGAIPQFFNALSNQNYDTNGQTIILANAGPGKFEHISVTNPQNITINGQPLSEKLMPQLRFSQPCGT